MSPAEAEAAQMDLYLRLAREATQRAEAARAAEAAARAAAEAAARTQRQTNP
ncbi:hypothetical protein ACWC5I_31520 [Kitasatospora sp. NPDC001574]